MTEEEIKVAFEEWYSEENSWSIRRGSVGRAGCHLKQYDGEYVSDHASEAYKAWCAAFKRMGK